MRISRYGTRPLVRRSRRRSGCMPFVLLLGLMLGIVLSSWGWLNRQLADDSAPSSNLQSGRSAFDRGDLTTAVEIARQVWQNQPENGQALLLLVRALVYGSYDDYDQSVDRRVALQLSSSAFERLPEDLDVLTAHAFTLQANGQSVEAARLVRIVLAQQPENTLARVVLGLAFGGVGGYQNALTQNQQTVAQADNYLLDAQRALAISLNDVGRYEDALEAIDAALAVNDRLLMLYFERALYAMQMGDADAATSAYFQVLAQQPENIKARLRLCSLSSLLRESETALEYCKEVIERAPGWVDGWYHLGREYYLRGDFAEAQQVLNRCTTLSVAQGINIEDRNLDCWYLQGQSAEIQGDCEGLLMVYNEFQAMAELAGLPQTWTYPPEGPLICQQ